MRVSAGGALLSGATRVIVARLFHLYGVDLYVHFLDTL
jgi:hypothetical protein